MKDEEYRKAHEQLASEFALARVVILARVTAGSYAGAAGAAATGTRLKISFERVETR